MIIETQYPFERGRESNLLKRCLGDNKIMTNETYLKLKQLSRNLSPSDLANSLGFKEALRSACNMLNNEEWDESLQEYATNVMESLRAKYPKEWNANWKCDALLGYAYHITLKYDERYAAYKRAFDRVRPPPPELLVAMARCCVAPGKAPITEEEAILLVKQAITIAPYVEAVELLRGLYKSTGNVKQQQYWEKVLEKVKEVGPHLAPLDKISDDSL